VLLAAALIVYVVLIHLQPLRDLIGGDVPATWIYDLGNVVLAWGAAGISLMLAGSFSKGEVLRRIWLLLGVGLLLWGTGEFVWALYELVLGIDPYPSAADVMYILGYIPLLAGMYLRFQSLQTTPERYYLITAIIIFLILVAIAWIFVFQPILFDPEIEPIERIVGILYPVGDLFISLGVITIVLVLTGGQLSRSWLIIAAGFLINAFADLFYTYADWQGLMPGGLDPLTPIAIIANISYFISYVVICLGLLFQARLQKII
jgi:diguanylate cyclase